MEAMHKDLTAEGRKSWESGKTEIHKLLGPRDWYDPVKTWGGTFGADFSAFIKVHNMILIFGREKAAFTYPYVTVEGEQGWTYSEIYPGRMSTFGTTGSTDLSYGQVFLPGGISSFEFIKRKEFEVSGKSWDQNCPGFVFGHTHIVEICEYAPYPAKTYTILEGIDRKPELSPLDKQSAIQLQLWFKTKHFPNPEASITALNGEGKFDICTKK